MGGGGRRVSVQERTRLLHVTQSFLVLLVINAAQSHGRWASSQSTGRIRLQAGAVEMVEGKKCLKMATTGQGMAETRGIAG